jgi:hypothetical protein
LTTIYWKKSSPIEYITNFVTAYTGNEVTSKEVESFDKNDFGFIKIHAEVDICLLMGGLKFMCPRYTEDDPFEDRIVYKFANKEKPRVNGDSKKWHKKNEAVVENTGKAPRQPQVKLPRQQRVKVVDDDGFVKFQKVKKENEE